MAVSSRPLVNLVPLARSRAYLCQPPNWLKVCFDRIDGIEWVLVDSRFELSAVGSTLSIGGFNVMLKRLLYDLTIAVPQLGTLLLCHLVGIQAALEHLILVQIV